MKTNKKGGKREGSGRPKGTIKQDHEKTKNRTIAMTDAEHAEYLKRGGARWLRPELQTKN